ncbi:FAD-dependent oxidoreductase [Streptomyces niveus]|uniref:FAD-dependent oxidoreductase n=1 Tax=Streptomyces niveus TaxID=193462 RepID=UPI003695F927
MSGEDGRPRTAVVGGGVAGLTAAYVLRRTHEVTLYEAEPRLGGHAHTHDLASSDGRVHTSTPDSSSTTSARIRCCCGSSANWASPLRSRR